MREDAAVRYSTDGTAEPLLLLVCMSGVTQPGQAPWEIPRRSTGLRDSRKLTRLSALGEEMLMAPGRPWLGILVVTRCSGMASVAPVSRDSFQQKPGMTGSGERCCGKDV